MLRTLIISDLHIGQTGGTAVLERPRPIEILLKTLADYDRLVLLGDIIEMLESDWSYSAPTAEAILTRLAETVPNIVLVPGNHDHGLITPWVQSQGADLAREALIPRSATPELDGVVGWLASGGASVEVRYPGVWLSDNVWATHGHYVNHFLVPVSSIGLHTRKHRANPAPPATPAQFENVIASEHRPRMHNGLPPQRWHDRMIPKALAPAVSWGLDIQVRRHAVPAFGQVVTALGVGSDPSEARGIAEPRAEYAIFGHVHRLGPMPLDSAREWQALGGQVQLVNTGSWRFEPVVANRADGLHPYWPGGAVALLEDGIPRPLNLLAQLSDGDLR